MSIGPFEFIKTDTTIEKGGRKFRLLVYGAYNAFGLIGPEKNGVAVLDEDERAVLCDEIGLDYNAFYLDPSPSLKQQQALDSLIDMSWEDFRKFINNNDRTRYTI